MTDAIFEYTRCGFLLISHQFFVMAAVGPRKAPPPLATESYSRRFGSPLKNVKTAFRRLWCATEAMYVTSWTTQTPSTPSARTTRVCDTAVR